MSTFECEYRACNVSATPSRSVSKRSAYVSNVIAADLWPSVRCSASTFTPALTASDAHVRRKSCGVMDCTAAHFTAATNHPVSESGLPR